MMKLTLNLTLIFLVEYWSCIKGWLQISLRLSSIDQQNHNYQQEVGGLIRAHPTVTTNTAAEDRKKHPEVMLLILKKVQQLTIL